MALTVTLFLESLWENGMRSICPRAKNEIKRGTACCPMVTGSYWQFAEFTNTANSHLAPNSKYQLMPELCQPIRLSKNMVRKWF